MDPCGLIRINDDYDDDDGTQRDVVLRLVSSDEDYCCDKTALSRTFRSADAADDAAADAVSLGTTTSTLPASGSDETLSRDLGVSTNHVAASSPDVDDARRDLPFVSRAEVGGVGPPWLLGSTAGTVLPGDGLTSLQFGASSLLALVYERQSSAAAAGTAGQRTAVPSSSTSISPRSSSATTAATVASVQSPVWVNVHRQTDDTPATSDSVVENHHRTERRSYIDEAKMVHDHQQSNSASESAPGGCTSAIAPTIDVEDWPTDAALLPDDEQVERPSTIGGVDEQTVERQSSSCDNVDGLPASSTPAAQPQVEDYLLPNSDDTRRAQTNDHDHEVLRLETEVNGHAARDETTADVSHALVDSDEDYCDDKTALSCTVRPSDDDADASHPPTSTLPASGGDETLSGDPAVSTNHVRDSNARPTVDVSPSVNDRLPVEFVPTDDMVAPDDARLDETSTSSERSENVDRCYINGHLPSTVADDVVDDPWRDCRDFSSHDAASAAITVSGSDVADFVDVEAECRRVAERMSVAWRDTERHSDDDDDDDDVVHRQLHQVDADIETATSPTLTASLNHVRLPPAQLSDVSRP